MERLGHDYEIYTTKVPMDACAKIRADAETDELRVYACGGDGTLNECVNGAAGLSGVSVTQYPCGTGNDFIKAFAGDGRPFLDLEALIYGHVHPIDLINCNGRMSINICSAGFDARVAADVHKYSSLPLIGGKGGYIISLAANFIKGVCQKLIIHSAAATFVGDTALVCACNGNWYGGSFNPMPDAVPNDGYLDFLIVHKLSRLNFLKLVGKYAAGRYRELDGFLTYIRGKRLEVESEIPIAVNVDGESLIAKKLSFEIIPGGVNFIFPVGIDNFAASDTNSSDIWSNTEISAG